jgi:hypothetical protein
MGRQEEKEVPEKSERGPGLKLLALPQLLASQLRWFINNI